MSTPADMEGFLRNAGFHILEAAMENVFVSDTEGRIAYVNPAAQETTGYGPGELIGKPVDVLYKNKDLARSAISEIKSSGRARVYEAVILDKRGRERILSIKKAPLFDTRAQLVGFLSVSRDMTEERLHEEELRAMKEFNEAVLNATQDMITVTDPDGMLTYFNPAAERITGYRKEEVLGRNVSMFYMEEARALDTLTEIEARGTASEYEALILDKQGREHVFSIHKAPLYDDERNLIGFTATSRDITDRRRREEELRRLTEFNEAVLASVHDLVVVTDVDGHILYYNPTAEQVTGYRFEEVRGRRISEFYKDPELSDEKLDYIRSTAEANTYQAVIVTRDGQERTLDVNKAPLHDASGELFGFTAVSRDITRRQQAEERVCQLEEVLSDNRVVQVESDLIHTRVADIVSDKTPACGPDETVAEAAERLIRHDLPALPVVGPARDLLGMVTLKDLAQKGLFQGVDLRTPIREVMKSDTFSIEPEAYYFDALAEMVRRRAQVLPVTEGRHLRGLLTMNDMMRSRGASIISVLDGIGEQSDIEGLSRFRGEVDRILMSLVSEGAPASQVIGIITEFNDRITRRVLALTVRSLGPPPVAFAWLGLGSEGRKEQTLTTDQDNAIVFDDRAETDSGASAYFEHLAERAVAALARCGFALCEGNVMASNPRWAGGLSAWLTRIRRWIHEPTPQRTRDAVTFLDFRRVYGDEELVRTLRDRTNEIFRDNPRVLTPMAEDALSKTPPLGLFKRFVVEKSGPRKGMLNLKTQGTLVLIDCLRVLAVQEGLFETNTLDRLNGLVDHEVLSRERALSVREAYQTLMGLRLRTNIAAMKDGDTPSNHMNPDYLPQWHQARLRDAFSVAEDLQKKLRHSFWWIRS